MEDGTRWRFPPDGCKFCEALDLEQRSGFSQHRKEAARKSPTQSQWGGGANLLCSHQRQPEKVDPKMTQLRRSTPARQRPRHSRSTLACGQFGSSLTSNGGFPRSRGGCSEERVVEGEASSPNTSTEGTACTERRVHPAFAEANCISGTGTRRRTALLDKAGSARTVEKQEVAAAERVPAEVPMQESSTEVLFLRAKVAQLEAERIPHPVRGSIDAVESLRLRLTKRNTGNCPEDKLPINQQDLHSWLESKQLELRDVLDVHDMESVSLLTGLISRGAAAMSSYLQPSSVH